MSKVTGVHISIMCNTMHIIHLHITCIKAINLEMVCHFYSAQLPDVLSCMTKLSWSCMKWFQLDLTDL